MPIQAQKILSRYKPFGRGCRIVRERLRWKRRTFKSTLEWREEATSRSGKQ